MNLREPLALLGGLSPTAFMRDHWQKRPLVIRQALPEPDRAVVGAAELFALAARDDVESRLIARAGDAWRLKHGPFPRRALPPRRRAGWTLLVQGVDGHVEAAHALLQRFRWVADARLDDIMVSYASPGGGVGPHVDSYDVFLLQLQGSRRWRVAPPDAGPPALVAGLPVRILQDFEPTADWLLEPGDMLYLPPRWGHDGVAADECLTCSIGYRAPAGAELARELLQRVLDDVEIVDEAPRYRDPAGAATDSPARMPPALGAFAARAVQRLLKDPRQLSRALGEVMTEPKATVWFDPAPALPAVGGALRLDRRTRMMYDEQHVFINGESFRAAGRDAALMRELADARRLAPAGRARLSAGAREVVADWVEQGWVHDD